jgi:hypothetical protein
MIFCIFELLSSYFTFLSLNELFISVPSLLTVFPYKNCFELFVRQLANLYFAGTSYWKSIVSLWLCHVFLIFHVPYSFARVSGLLREYPPSFRIYRLALVEKDLHLWAGMEAPAGWGGVIVSRKGVCSGGFGLEQGKILQSP